MKLDVGSTALSLEAQISVGATPTRRVIDSIDLDFPFVKRMVNEHVIVLDHTASVYLESREAERRYHGIVDTGNRESDAVATLRVAMA